MRFFIFTIFILIHIHVHMNPTSLHVYCPYEHTRQKPVCERYRFANDLFFAFFFSPTQPSFHPAMEPREVLPGNKCPPARATTILNQQLYIVFYLVYIGVKIRLSSPATEWAPL